MGSPVIATPAASPQREVGRRTLLCGMESNFQVHGLCTADGMSDVYATTSCQWLEKGMNTFTLWAPGVRRERVE